MTRDKFITTFKFINDNPTFKFINVLRKKYPGSEVFLVGGAVRDALLNRPNKDFDFLIKGIELKDLQSTLEELGRVDLVGKVFGVLKFIPKEQEEVFRDGRYEAIDIALPRTEHSFLSGGYKDFEIKSNPHLNLEEDLQRRDFTINALALFIGDDVEDHILIDLYDGLYDLENGIIKTVLNPVSRFKEDYSRMLRCIRFSCQLGFEIEGNTLKTIEKNVRFLMEKHDEEWIVPRETIAKELLKAFYADPLRAFDIFDSLKIFEVLIPEVNNMKGCPQPLEYHNEGDVFEHTRLLLKNLLSEEFEKTFFGKKPDVELILALLFHDIGKPPTIKTPGKDGTDRIRFDEHDDTGARMAVNIIDRLKLESQPEGSPLHVSAKNIEWLIKKHLILLNDPRKMKSSTIEKYFFNENVPGKKLLKLCYCDMKSSTNSDQFADMSNFDVIKQRIEEIASRAKTEELPKSLLDGNEIMSLFNIKQGPQVGKILDLLREKQLDGELVSKEEAKIFLTSNSRILFN